jgi:hypothetical protein
MQHPAKISIDAYTGFLYADSFMPSVMVSISIIVLNVVLLSVVMLSVMMYAVASSTNEHLIFIYPILRSYLSEILLK